MTPADAHTLAQTDPTPNLTAQWGELTAKTRATVDTLNQRLRELDRITEQLAERGLTVSTDLGPVGNAAAAARRDLEKQKPDTFELPRVA